MVLIKNEIRSRKGIMFSILDEFTKNFELNKENVNTNSNDKIIEYILKIIKYI